MSYMSDHLKHFSEIAECIAEQFGTNCEVVLHDLTRPYDNTIIAIWNGHVTGRQVGGSVTNTGLAIIKGEKVPQDKYGYISYTDDGKVLKSSSKYFIDEKGKLQGSLCINYDITDISEAQKALKSFIKPHEEEREIFSSNVDELLEKMMENAVEATGKLKENLNKEDKVFIVKYLDKKGAFLIKKSAERVAEFLEISRFTVYNYLNELQEEDR